MRPLGSSRTLADVLIAEDQEHVPADVIVAVLRSITLTDDIMASGSDIPARAVFRGLDYVFGDAVEPRATRAKASARQPVVSTKAQFSYGVHVGARPKRVPEYIGATNRADRRRARLAEQDDRIATAAGQEAKAPTRRPTPPPRGRKTSAAPGASFPTPGRSRRRPRRPAARRRCWPGRVKTSR